MSEIESDDTLVVAVGVSGNVIFDGDFITLQRKGLRARLTVGKGEKRIPVASVTAVQWKPAGPVMNGFIQFTLGGGNERRSRFGSQTASAVGDENSVVFTRKQAPYFEALREAVEGAIAWHHSPRDASPSAADELAKFAALRERGVLTEGEFVAKKAQILGL